MHEGAKRVTRHRAVKIFVLATIYSSNANRTARFENQYLIDERTISIDRKKSTACRFVQRDQGAKNRKKLQKEGRGGQRMVARIRKEEMAGETSGTWTEVDKDINKDLDKVRDTKENRKSRGFSSIGALNSRKGGGSRRRDAACKGHCSGTVERSFR